MALTETTAESLIGHVVTQLTKLPPENLPVVAAFVDYLSNHADDVARRSVAQQLVGEAMRRIKDGGTLPRSEAIARFQQVAEAIRQEAIRKDTAIEGDLIGD